MSKCPEEWEQEEIDQGIAHDGAGFVRLLMQGIWQKKSSDFQQENLDASVQPFYICRNEKGQVIYSKTMNQYNRI